MDLSYKRASNEDISTLLALEKSIEGSRFYYSERSTQTELLEEINNGVVYLIEKEGEIVGEVMYEKKSFEYVYIGWVFVHPNFRGQGVAKQAMEYVLNEIEKVKRIDLVTHPENTKAIFLYESLGFIIESRKENYFGDGEPRVVMALVKDVM